MRRQLGVGLLTKIARNGRLTNLVWPKSASPSSFLKPNSSPFHQRSFSEYSTLSRSHLWKICCPIGVKGTIKSMVFPSSLLARRVFSNALLQGRPKFPVTIRNRRSLNSFSLDRRRRGSFSRRFSTNVVVLGLVLTNVAVFTLWKVADSQFMVKNFKMGKKFGPQYLLKLYLAGALAGSIFYVAYQAFIAPSIYKGDPEDLAYSRLPAMGASGATTGIMLLYIFLFPKRTMFEMIIPVPAALVGIILRLGGDAGEATVAALAWLQKRKGRFGQF